MDAYQVRTWEGWHHHMALTLMAVWFLVNETHRGQQLTPALTLPQVRYGLSMLLLEGSARSASPLSVATSSANYCATSWLDSTIIAPVTACHERSCVETYSKFNRDNPIGEGGVCQVYGLEENQCWSA